MMYKYLWCTDCYRAIVERRSFTSLKINSLVVIHHGVMVSGLLCDYCGKALLTGDTCYSISLLETPGSYKEWESEHMEVLERIEYPQEEAGQSQEKGGIKRTPEGI